jgi:hypothetical protein
MEARRAWTRLEKLEWERGFESCRNELTENESGTRSQARLEVICRGCDQSVADMEQFSG